MIFVHPEPAFEHPICNTTKRISGEKVRKKSARSDFGFQPAGAHEAPACYGFKNGKQSCRHQNQSEPQHIVHGDDARDEAQRADDTARQAAAMTDIGLKETAHRGNLAHRVPKKQVEVALLRCLAKNSIAFRSGGGQIPLLQSRGVA